MVDATAFSAASRAFFFITRGSPFSVTRSLRVIVRLRRMGAVDVSEKDMRCYEMDGSKKNWMTRTYICFFLILYSTRWQRQLNPFEKISSKTFETLVLFGKSGHTPLSNPYWENPWEKPVKTHVPVSWVGVW